MPFSSGAADIDAVRNIILDQSCVCVYLKFCTWKDSNAGTGSQRCGAFLAHGTTLRPCCSSFLWPCGTPQGPQPRICHLGILLINCVYDTRACTSPVCTPHFLPVMMVSHKCSSPCVCVCVCLHLLGLVFCCMRGDQQGSTEVCLLHLPLWLLKCFHICISAEQIPRFFFSPTPTLDPPPHHLTPPPSLPCADLLPASIIGDERPQ